MAKAVITPTKVGLFQKLTPAIAFTALDGTDGGEIAWDGKDVHGVILVKNASTTTSRDLTIKGGNSEYGINDVTFAIPHSETRAFSIESGFFKNVSGTDKGKVILTGNANLEVAVIFLP